MFREKDSSDNYGIETSETRVSHPDSGQNLGDPDKKTGFSGKGLDFLRDSGEEHDVFQSKPLRPANLGFLDRKRSDSGENLEMELVKTSDKLSEKVEFPQMRLDFLRESVIDRGGFESKPGNSGCQELTLSYLCDNLKSGFVEKNSLERGLLSLKGKGIVSEQLNQEEKWVERDFLQLNDSEGGSLKRESHEETKLERDCSKKPKLETLKLSLAPPEMSFSLTASNAAPNCDAGVQLKPTRSVQSLGLSNNNTQTTCSNDFMAASLSYSYSHPLSHNPSCSLTRNSTENFENSVSNQIWHCGEGTNGSVHSRFKPIGDGTSLSNHGSGVVYSLLNRGRPLNKDASNSLYRAAGSDNSSFFPSELPARPIMETMYSVNSMGKSLDHFRGLDRLEDKRAHKISTGERIVRDAIAEPIHVMSQVFQEFPTETIELAKEYLKSLMATPERKNELLNLQNLLERRPDLTKETLSKSHKAQLEILVAVKFGLDEYVSGKVRLPTSELVEIFLFMRCRNVNCKSFLPVDDCDCKICSTTKGFCSQCMCPVCYKYDCANNTCSWVGCDTCSHWCHASCGTEKNLIRPGVSVKGSSGTTQMQFYCLGCGRASEMFGFVKDVFVYCAKDWDLQTLIKELDCVRKIFKGSEDLKGKQLYIKAVELIARLERRVMSPSDACNFIVHFFTSKEGTAEVPSAGNGAKNTTPPLSSSNVSSKSDSFNFLHGTPKAYLSSHQHHEDDFSGKLSKDGFDSLENIVRMKEAESRMFQKRADEARKEVEAYRQLVNEKIEKIEKEYSEKIAKLCLTESEERRKKRLEELNMLENSHTDYYNMKMRMQAEISGLLERMAATKVQWV